MWSSCSGCRYCLYENERPFKYHKRTRCIVNARGKWVRVRLQECFTQEARAVFGSSKDDLQIHVFIVQALSGNESRDVGTQYSDSGSSRTYFYLKHPSLTSTDCTRAGVMAGVWPAFVGV